VRIEDALLQVFEGLAERPNQSPDPDRASRGDIAAWCGIRNLERIEDWRVPADQYRHAGNVACSRSGQQPDPPWVVVARYELPNGDRAVMAHEVAAEEFQAAYGLTDGEAEALALHRAGWTARDLVDDWEVKEVHTADAPELLQEATEKARA
jgi:hypothetical protein